MHRPALEAAGNVPLGGDGVVVPGEHEQRGRGTALARPEERLVSLEGRCELWWDERPEPLAYRLLLEAFGRDVDELERPAGEAVCEVAHAGEPTARRRRHTSTDDGRRTRARDGPEPERGLLLAVMPKGVDLDAELAELRELARTAGVAPVAEIVQRRTHVDPRRYVGKGKLEELKASYGDHHAEVLLVDDELAPVQQRALEDALSARVVDRTQLILDIFAQHAVSAEGKLQVELAQLEYNLPRMRGMWKHLERLGGGVGTRGPGESQLETDRRLANTRITLLRRRLRELRGHRATRRKARARSETPTVALAGYTNVGKSTLLNALTGAEVPVEDRLFETLDPTTRSFQHAGSAT